MVRAHNPGRACEQSQRDCVLQPKVASNEPTLGKRRGKMTTATRLGQCLACCVQTQTYFSSIRFRVVSTTRGASPANRQVKPALLSPATVTQTPHANKSSIFTGNSRTRTPVAW